MANQFVSFTPYDEQMAELQRRQRLAELMQQQAMQPLETPQSGGRMIAKVSPLAGLAKMLQAYSAGAEARDIEKQRGEVEKGARTEALDYLRSFNPEQKTIGMGEAAMANLPIPQVSNTGNVSYQQTAPLTNVRTVGGINEPLQVQTGKPLSRREQMSRAEEGMFSSNPLVRALAQSKYDAASRRNLQLDKIDPSKFTPESVRSAFDADDAGLLKQIEKPTEGITPYQAEQLKIDRERLDFQKSKPGQAANQPKAPPGFRYTAQGDLEFIPGGPNDPNAPKAMPPSILSANNADAGDVKRLQGNKDMLQGFINDLSGDKPKLPLSVTKNATYQLDQATSGVLGRGSASPEAVRFFELKRAISEQVNEILNRAKGPQTDQDARRAQQQILENLNDTNIVISGLKRLQEIYDLEMQIRNDSIAERNAAYGRGGGSRSAW